MQRNFFPQTTTGILSVILAVLTLAAYIGAAGMIIRSLGTGSGIVGPQLGVVLGSILVLIPAVMTVLTSLLAIKLPGLHDRSRLVRIALWLAIILAATAWPVFQLIVSCYAYQWLTTGF